MKHRNALTPANIAMIIVFVLLALGLQLMMSNESSFSATVGNMISESPDRQCFMLSLDGGNAETAYKFEKLGEKYCIIKESDTLLRKNDKVSGIIETSDEFPTGLLIKEINQEKKKVHLVPAF